ncbi:ABC transporter permease [Candidatus Woesearchaeota archaeon]|nr:ABC transporter permease [Candidatus Woesearchaeota archaeon]
MNLQRTWALVKRDYQSFKNGKWKWLEAFYFPITTIFIWGLFSMWSKEMGTELGKVIVIINIFWSYVYIVQSTANTQMSEDLWSHSGRSLFAAGVTAWEYVLARCIFSLLISLPVLLIILSLALFFFKLNFMLIFPLQTLHLLFLTACIGITWAIIIAGLLFLAGREFGFLSWSLFHLFIMLSFPLFPVELLPTAVQNFASAMPLTELFSAVRSLSVGEAFSLGKAWIISLVYLVLGSFFYQFAVSRARKSGKLVKGF